MNPLLKLAVEAGPLVIFFAANASLGIYVATGAFMVAVTVALAMSWFLERRLAAVPLASAAIVLVFGGLTLWLNNETFIKVKPTILNGLFAVALLGGLAAGRTLLKPLFGAAFAIDDPGWRKLTVRWAVFFAVMAVLNEAVWRSVSTDTWVAVKVFGYLPLTLAFAMAQLPLIQRHSLPEVATAESE